MFDDSFGAMMPSLLAPYFRRADFISQYREIYTKPDWVWDTAVIEKRRPDIVVDEIIERSIISISTEHIIPTVIGP